MAIILGDAKYGFSFKYNKNSEQKSKTFNYINIDGTNEGSGYDALGANPTSINEFVTMINASIIGGTVMNEYMTTERAIYDTGE